MTETETLKMFKELIFEYGTACEKAIDHNLDASIAEGVAYEKVTAYLLSQICLARADERKQAYEDGKNAACDYLMKHASDMHDPSTVRRYIESAQQSLNY